MEEVAVNEERTTSTVCRLVGASYELTGSASTFLPVVSSANFPRNLQILTEYESEKIVKV